MVWLHFHRERNSSCSYAPPCTAQTTRLPPGTEPRHVKWKDIDVVVFKVIDCGSNRQNLSLHTHTNNTTSTGAYYVVLSVNYSGCCLLSTYLDWAEMRQTCSAGAEWDIHLVWLTNCPLHICSHQLRTWGGEKKENQQTPSFCCKEERKLHSGMAFALLFLGLPVWSGASVRAHELSLIC